MNTAIMLVIGLFIVMLIQLVLLRSRYITCPPNKLLIIYGRVEESENGAKIIEKGSVFVWPVIQEYVFLDLSLCNIEINKNCQLKDNKNIKIKLRLSCKISKDKNLSRRAAERLLGNDKDGIKEIASDFIESQLIKTLKGISSIEIENEINIDQSVIENEIDNKLAEIGMTVENITIEFTI